MPKWCSRCKKTKTTKEFYRERATKDGLQRWCKVCKKEYSKEHPEYYYEYNRRRRGINRSAYTLSEVDILCLDCCSLLDDCDDDSPHCPRNQALQLKKEINSETS